MPDRFREVIEEKPYAVEMHAAVNVENARRHRRGAAGWMCFRAGRHQNLFAQMIANLADDFIIGIRRKRGIRPMLTPRGFEHDVAMPDEVAAVWIGSRAERMLFDNQTAAHRPQPNHVEQ